MTGSKIKKDDPLTARKHLALFRKCLPLQVKLHELIRALGSTEEQTCLDIGLDNGAMSYHLRRRGGKWHTVVSSDTIADAVRTVVEDNVHSAGNRVLPFKKKFFDAVIVNRFLDGGESDTAFIEECHRVLKSDGRLIVIVAHAKRWTIIKPLRRLLGASTEKKGATRAGYSETQLFRSLKNGFDVHNMRSFSRFFIELTDAFVRPVAERMGEEKSGGKGIARLYSVALPFYWLAHQLDMLLFFTRGHYLIASAKRRSWRSRDAPVLVDGRSISEAVLSRPSDK